MSDKWIVIGISGATCSGKSTLAHNLHEVLPQSVTICQDDYFFPVDSPHHVKCEFLDHINWELMSALDMKRMRSDIQALLCQEPSSAALPSKAKRVDIDKVKKYKGIQGNFPNILILEGFLLLNDDEISSLCDLRYYLTLSREECWARRSARTYDPPDIPGFFDGVVWPEYVKNRDKILVQSNVKVIDGITPTNHIMEDVVRDILNVISSKRESKND